MWAATDSADKDAPRRSSARSPCVEIGQAQAAEPLGLRSIRGRLVLAQDAWLRPRNLARAARSVLSLNRSREYGCLVRMLSLEREDAVLDIGSGDGFWTQRLARNARRVVGLEPDEDLLSHARRFQHHGNVDYIQGVAERLPFADANFDKVISISCLEHFGDPWAALGEMRRVLRPGGRLALSVDSLLAENSSQAFRRWHSGRHAVQHYFRESDLLAAVRAVGLEPDQEPVHLFRSPLAGKLRERFIRAPRRWLPLFPVLYGAVRFADMAWVRHHGQIVMVGAQASAR